MTAGAIDDLFAQFDLALTERGYLALGGQLIDAFLIEAPRQRLTVEEKQCIRAGERLYRASRQGPAQGHRDMPSAVC